MQAREHVYATWRRAEALYARGHTLQAFLLLYALLPQPPRPSASHGYGAAMTSVTTAAAQAVSKLRTSGTDDKDDKDDDSDKEEEARVSACFASHTRRDEVDTRVRAAEYLLYGDDDKDKGGKDGSVCSTATLTRRCGAAAVAHEDASRDEQQQQQQQRWRASQERLALVHELLAPLLDYSDSAHVSWPRTASTLSAASPSSLVRRGVVAHMGNAAYVSIANVTPLVWCAAPFVLRARARSADDDGVDTTTTVAVTAAHAAVLTPVALLLRAYVLQATVAQRRRQYERAYALLRCAERWLSVTFAADAMRQATCDLYDELQMRIRCSSSNNNSSNNSNCVAAAASSSSGDDSWWWSSEVAAREAMHDVVTRERVYCEAVLACELCHVLHALWTSATSAQQQQQHGGVDEASDKCGRYVQLLHMYASGALAALSRIESRARRTQNNDSNDDSDSSSIASVLHARCLVAQRARCTATASAAAGGNTAGMDVRALATTLAHYSGFAAVMQLQQSPCAAQATASPAASLDACAVWRRLQRYAVQLRQCTRDHDTHMTCTAQATTTTNTTVSAMSNNAGDVALLQQLFAFDVQRRASSSCAAHDMATMSAARKRERADDDENSSSRVNNDGNNKKKKDGDDDERGCMCAVVSSSWLSPCVRRAVLRLLVWLRCVHGVTVPSVMQSDDNNDKKKNSGSRTSGGGDNNKDDDEAVRMREQLLHSVLRSVDQAMLRLSATAPYAQRSHSRLVTPTAPPCLFAHAPHEVRLLVRVKATALLTAASCALTQLDVLSTVRHLHTAQQYVALFAPHAHALCADVHLLASCLALALALRDRHTLQQLQQQQQHDDKDDAQQANSTTTTTHHEQQDDEEAVLCDVVGLPYAHLCAAARVATTPATRLLIDVCKAWVLYDASTRGDSLQLQLQQLLPSSSSSPRQAQRRDDATAAAATTTTTTTTTTTAAMYTITQLALTQRRRCAAALRTRLRALHAGYRHCQRLRDGVAVHSAHDDSDSGSDCADGANVHVLAAGGATVAAAVVADDDDDNVVTATMTTARQPSAWLPMHVALLQLLRGAVAYSEEHNPARAVRRLRAATHYAKQHLGTYSPLVADGLRLLAHVCQTRHVHQPLHTSATRTSANGGAEGGGCAAVTLDGARAALVAMYISVHTNHTALLHLQSMQSSNSSNNGNSNSSNSNSSNKENDKSDTTALPALQPVPDMRARWRAQVEQLLLQPRQPTTGTAQPLTLLAHVVLVVDMFESNLLSQVNVQSPLPTFVETEVIASIRASLHKAFVFAHTLLAERSSLAAGLQPYSDELYYAALALWERFLLLRVDSTFVELMFGLRVGALTGPTAAAPPAHAYTSPLRSAAALHETLRYVRWWLFGPAPTTTPEERAMRYVNDGDDNIDSSGDGGVTTTTTTTEAAAAANVVKDASAALNSSELLAANRAAYGHLRFAPLLLRQKYALVLLLTLRPYLEQRLMNYYRAQVDDAEDAVALRDAYARRHPLRALLVQRVLVRLVIPAYHVVARASDLLYKLLYLLELTPYPSLPHRLCNVALRRATMKDNLVARSTRVRRALLYARMLLLLIFFGFRLLDYSRSDRGGGGLSGLQDEELPIPPPPVWSADVRVVDKASTANITAAAGASAGAPALAVPEAGVCPVCCKRVTNASVCTATGIVGCYPCMQAYIHDHHTCPVTGKSVTAEQLRRVYES